MSGDERIMLPRLGAHLRVWGSGHVCDSAGPHDGPCVCECGIPAPYDQGGTDDEQAEAGVGVAGVGAGVGAVLPRAPDEVSGVSEDEVECPICGVADLGCLLGMHWRPAYDDQGGIEDER